MKVFSFALAVLGLCAFAPLHAGEPIKNGVTPEAHLALKKISDFHKTLRTGSADIKLTITQELPGKPKQDMVLNAKFAVERPRNFKLAIEGEQGGITIVCDGDTVWTYLPALKQFTVDTAPMNLDILLRYHDPAPKAMSQLGPLCELFRNDPAGLILDPISVLKDAGTETVGGVECIRLHGEQADMEWDAWFDKGDQPLLRKYVFSPMKGMLAAASPEDREKLMAIRLYATVEYSWKAGAVAAGTFAYTPPEGVQKVAHFMAPEEGQPGGGGGGGGEAAHALKGKPAPDFTLNTLAGGKAKISDHKGKVIVLDFWASWCGPCVQALPQISAAAKAREEKGVIFFAVNQQEEADEIKAFLKARNLDVPVALDVEGAAAKAYGVQGIPQTVVIDKQGNVADVHVGFSPNMKEALGKTLDELLAK